MDNKFNNLLTEFLKNNEGKSEEELNEALQAFINDYNEGVIEYEETLLDKAYKILEKAEDANTEKQAIKLAKEAFELCPACFDAILFQVDIEESSLKREELLDEGLKFEKQRLTNEGFFDKDNIGHFYALFETRPYMRGLYMKAHLSCIEGKINVAKNVCKEILKLNKHDNMGARYLLMAIYAYQEDEKSALALFKKFPEEHLEMLYPLFTLYYKLGDYENARKYLNRINKANPNFIKYFNGTIKPNNKVPEGYHGIGDSSEVLMYFEHYFFLFLSTPEIVEFIKKYSKK